MVEIDPYKLYPFSLKFRLEYSQTELCAKFWFKYRNWASTNNSN